MIKSELKRLNDLTSPNKSESVKKVALQIINKKIITKPKAEMSRGFFY
jgi:hypothetical protein